ncbi:hypothetical protein Tco_1422796 [Tanacetum coccineum]
MEHEVPNRRDDVNNFKDYYQEDGELPDLPTFSATDEFASNSEQVEENIDIAEEKEGVPMKDVEMDENHNIDHLGRHFKSGLVRYHAEDDDGIFVIMDVARKSRHGAWLRA